MLEHRKVHKVEGRIGVASPCLCPNRGDNQKVWRNNVLKRAKHLFYRVEGINLQKERRPGPGKTISLRVGAERVRGRPEAEDRPLQHLF